MSRHASPYESGIGWGFGFRDSNRDLLGFVNMVPERARERILDLAATQLRAAERIINTRLGVIGRQRRLKANSTALNANLACIGILHRKLCYHV